MIIALEALPLLLRARWARKSKSTKPRVAVYVGEVYRRDVLAGPNCSVTDMSKLWECAKRGDADAVGELLDAGADPNDPDQAQQPVRPWPAAIKCPLQRALLAKRPWPRRQGAALCILPRRAASSTL